jgi:hypothetical protein
MSPTRIRSAHRKETRTMSKPLAVLAAASMIAGLSLASTAFAGEWDVNGTKLVGTAALLNTALVLTLGDFELTEFRVPIECRGETIGIGGGQLTAPDSLLASSITLKECLVPIGEGACQITGGAISTLPVQGLASLDGLLSTFIELLPKTKTLFAIIPFEGSECPFKGSEALVGGIDFLLHDGQDPRTSHLTLVFALPGQLRFGADDVLLTGLDIDPRLASNQTWNFL